ncbi:hypothetical protein V5O48_013559 [Marasmius crinis-equi]|uniref:C2H2-type domain-containing protein n=1 Tax=Marasmius crinis-equi TaxID=585013 RepID=A0ABR3EZR1_9AGAR
MPPASKAKRYQCHYEGCARSFFRTSDLTRHLNTAIHKAGILRNRSLSPSPPLSIHSPSIGPAPGDLDLLTPLLTPEANPPPSALLSPPSETAAQPKHIQNHHLIFTGEICDENGVYIPPNSLPKPLVDKSNPWSPFNDEVGFHLANLLFKKAEMSQANVNELLDLWALDIHNRCNDTDSSAPFSNQRELLETIDSIKSGSAPWKCLETTPAGDPLEQATPEWKKASYQVWYRDPDTVVTNILANPDFAKEFDPAPYVQVGVDGQRQLSDFMSGNYTFRHATLIHEELGATVQGAMYCPIILGADKTTVSIATGHVKYHPLYLSIGNLHGAARRGHHNGVVPIGFLAIPKSDRKYDDSSEFRVLRKQLYHASIAAILQLLKSGMTTPVVRLCPDGHFRRIVYDLAAFIADYPEQVLLAGVVQGWCCRCAACNNELEGRAQSRSREWVRTVLEEYGGDGSILWDNFGIDDDVLPFTHFFPCADIHEMLTADLLHQVIKGCFKDMLVEWTWTYLELVHGEAGAKEIMDDIDHRIALSPAFPGLRRFPHGRRFKQWTGDDSKALMKVFVLAVVEYLPEKMVQCLVAFLDFCYLVRRNDFTQKNLDKIQEAVDRFNEAHEIFRYDPDADVQVCQHFSIPRMHAMMHYRELVLEFGAPNGVCSSITESRHITAVKKPWRCSNRNSALSQMLLSNQRLDKMAALRSDLVERGLVPRLHEPPPDPFEVGNEDEGAVDEECIPTKIDMARKRAPNYPRYLPELEEELQQPSLTWLARRFLHEQLLR